MNVFKRIFKAFMGTQTLQAKLTEEREITSILADRVLAFENDLALLEDKYRGKKRMLNGHRKLLNEIVMSDKTTLTPEILEKAFDLLERSQDD